MIVRVCTARLAPGARDRYLAFACERSLPMLHRQPGCAGAHLLSLPDGREAVLTLWEDDGSLLTLEHSPGYRDTVRTLRDSGMLAGATAVRTLAVPAEIAEALRALSRELA